MENNYLHKINNLCWDTTHWKIVGGYKFQRHGFPSPLRCALCHAHEETIKHLFIEFSFTQRGMETSYGPL